MIIITKESIKQKVMSNIERFDEDVAYFCWKMSSPLVSPSTQSRSYLKENIIFHYLLAASHMRPNFKQEVIKRTE